MTFTVRAKGQDTDLGGYTYRLQCQQQPGASGITANAQIQVVSKPGPIAAMETTGAEFTLTQLAAILEPTS